MRRRQRSTLAEVNKVPMPEAVPVPTAPPQPTGTDWGAARLTPVTQKPMTMTRFVDLAEKAKDTVRYIRTRGVEHYEGCTFRRLVEELWEISWRSDLK